MSFFTTKSKLGQKSKKKAPPRPPPPNVSNYKSKSSQISNENLIEWSPPNTPKTEPLEPPNHNFGGSASSSFSSSTSSLASSRKSFECDTPISNNIWPINLSSSNGRNSSFSTNVPFIEIKNKPTINNEIPSISILPPKSKQKGQLNIPSAFGPTIIRPRPPKTKFSKESVSIELNPPSPPSLPMPSIPPPSPPKDIMDEDIAYGVASYDFEARETTDLSFQVNDIIILIKKLNNEWYYGKTQDREGIFPSNFIDVIVPLPEKDNIVTAMYDFPAQIEGDLALKSGQLVKVIKKINDDWLYGEVDGQAGQFPSTFVDRVPMI